MRQIPNYPDYVISENGEVYRTVFRNRRCIKEIIPKMLKQWDGGRGYKRVGLTQNGKTTFKSEICKLCMHTDIKIKQYPCNECDDAFSMFKSDIDQQLQQAHREEWEQAKKEAEKACRNRAAEYWDHEAGALEVAAAIRKLEV